MKVLVTGSNGLIGQKIINSLSLSPDNYIIAASRNRPVGKYEQPNIHIHTFDLVDKNRVKEIFIKHKPDVLINTAAVTQVDDCELNENYCRSVNTGAVEYLVKLAKDSGTFFLQLSTDFVFNGKNGPYSEDDMPDPISIYGRSKLDAESIIISSGIKHAIVRTILVYGYSDILPRQNIVTWVIYSLKAGKKIRVVSDLVQNSNTC
jgi:dTDP-4-dehydrorhamnose reductase